MGVSLLQLFIKVKQTFKWCRCLILNTPPKIIKIIPLHFCIIQPIKYQTQGEITLMIALFIQNTI